MHDQQEEARIANELTRSENGTDPFSAAVRATRMPMIITDPRQDDNPIVFVNNSFLKLTGYERNEILGRNCRFLQGPDTDRADVNRLRSAIEARECIELDLFNYRKDGTSFWNRLLVSPVFDDDGALTYFFASQYDVTLERERLVRLQRDRDELEAEVARRTADLHASEQRLRFALKAGRLGSWSLDLSSGRLIASDGCKESFGRPLGQPFTYEELKAAVHPDDRERHEAALASAIEHGTDYEDEYRVLTPDGEERWVQVRGQAHAQADGVPLSVVGVSQDVTERKRDDDHQTLLANELSHRVKNMLATLQAIIVQTLRNTQSTDEACDILEARIQAMAAANDLLVNGKWESAPLPELLGRTLAPFGYDDRRRFQGDGPDILIPPRIAVALSLALHELATNAAKYGALSAPEGRVQVAWDVVKDSQNHLHLSWIEKGGPPVTPPTHTGFGSKLIERVLSREVGGKALVDYQPSGVVFTVIAPLPASNEIPAAS